ncbi:MAG: helix-turn-helix transcriptional regulator [Candidatus Brockarchaeota archaeon]|nr:helix-turn-helix transcriptional regulator [Candidatus Brockarchaeota archaeon]
MEIATKMDELTGKLGELELRISKLESRIQELEASKESAVVEGGEEPWEAAEIGKVVKKWYDAVKRGVIVSATREELGGWANASEVQSLTKLPLDRVVFLLSPFSSEQRLRILLLLLEYPKASTDLSKTTGFEGGQLYHHLEELMEAKYVEKVYKGKYRLTEMGRWALYNVLNTAQHLINFPGNAATAEETDALKGKSIKG